VSRLTIVRWHIADTGTASDGEVDLREFQLLGLQLPNDWDAATIGFKSRPGLNAGDALAALDVAQVVTDSDGTACTISAAASKYVVFTTTEKEMVSGLAVTTLTVSAAQSPARDIIGIVAGRP